MNQDEFDKLDLAPDADEDGDEIPIELEKLETNPEEIVPDNIDEEG